MSKNRKHCHLSSGKSCYDNANPLFAEPLTLRHQIHARLGTLSYGAFCLLVRHLLYQSGYTSVHAVGRLFRPDALPKSEAGEGEGNPFNPRHGGLDLIALSHTDLATSLTLIQVKQYKEPVPRRFIDELRGAMLRLGAEQGLLVTSSRFSSLARDAAGGAHMRPVHLVDGTLLVEMLLTRRIGLRGERGGKGKEQWVLDAGFFNALEDRCRWLASTKAERGKNSPEKAGCDDDFLNQPL